MPRSDARLRTVGSRVPAASVPRLMREAICARICSKGGTGERRLTEMPAAHAATSFRGRGAGGCPGQGAHGDDGDDHGRGGRGQRRPGSRATTIRRPDRRRRRTRPARTPPPRRWLWVSSRTPAWAVRVAARVRTIAVDGDGAQGGVQAARGIADALAGPGREERRQGGDAGPGREQRGRNPAGSSASRACPAAVTMRTARKTSSARTAVVSRAGLTGCRGQLRGASGMP